MTNRAHVVAKLLVLTFVLTGLLACNQSTQPTQRAADVLAAASTPEKVFVVFEGPWAFVADPKDAKMVLALAPKTKAHRDLNVSASNNATLAAGVYELSVPPHGAPTTAALDPTFAQAKIDTKSLQRALDDKSGRYVIRLPKPEGYAAAARQRARVGATYPPDASSEQNYVTQVSLSYSVASLSGFTVAGTPDSGSFNPALLQLDTPTIRFVIEPATTDLTDLCSIHSHFPDDVGDCHKSDPQVRAANMPMRTPATIAPQTPIYVALLAHVQFGILERNLLAALYLLHPGGGACKAPILFLTVS